MRRRTLEAKFYAVHQKLAENQAELLAKLDGQHAAYLVALTALKPATKPRLAAPKKAPAKKVAAKKATKKAPAKKAAAAKKSR